MPTTRDVQSTVAELVARLTGGDPADAVPGADLRDLGITSLLTVELVEELGRRYGVYLADEVVDGYRTVGDVVDSVVHHNGALPPGWVESARPEASERDLRPSAAGMSRAVVTMTMIGASIGAALGFGGSTLLDAAGLSDAGLPPIAAASSASPSPTPSADEPEPSPTPDDPAAPQPTLTTPKEQVAPGERFTLSGSFPGLETNTELQVEVKEPGQGWDSFPVTAAMRPDGTYETEVYTSRTGERQFRLTHVPTGRSTPAVDVTIG